nr:hypothetical protein [uncultured Fluviicola sp.]
MRLAIYLSLILTSIQFYAQSQFYAGGFGGYNLASRLNTGIFTEYSLDEFFPATLRFSYTYSFPYLKPGDENPILKHTNSNYESAEFFIATQETFRHHSFLFDYKQYSGDFDATTGGFYGRAIVGFTFSKVTREWIYPVDPFIVANFDLFPISQTSLNLGFAMGYDFLITDNLFLYADLAAMLPYIKLSSTSTRYDGFPEFSLGLQLGAKYKIF